MSRSASGRWHRRVETARLAGRVVVEELVSHDCSCLAPNVAETPVNRSRQPGWNQVDHPIRERSREQAFHVAGDPSHDDAPRPSSNWYETKFTPTFLLGERCPCEGAARGARSTLRWRNPSTLCSTAASPTPPSHAGAANGTTTSGGPSRRSPSRTLTTTRPPTSYLAGRRCAPPRPPDYPQRPRLLRRIGLRVARQPLRPGTARSPLHDEVLRRRCARPLLPHH